MKRFAIRTIKDGRVKIHGRYFYPDDRYVEYDGRLDGMRFVFGLYYTPAYSVDYGKGKATGYTLDAKVCIIRQDGSPVRFDPDDQASHSDNRPEVVDGAIPWLFWFENV